MKIIFDPRAYSDLIWFDHYFEEKLSEGKEKATQNFNQTLEIISNFPEIGFYDDEKDLRELLILKTTFVLIYKVFKDKIVVVSVWDTRQNSEKKNKIKKI